MLVLSRLLGQRIMIGEGANQITVTVVDIDRGKIRLGIEAPRDVPIFREELLPRRTETSVAVPEPHCPECAGSGYAIHPHNGWNPNSKRCSRGCRVFCSVCSDPDCDNPGGQH